MSVRNSPPLKTKLNEHILIILIIMFTEVLGFSLVLPVIPYLGLSLGLNAFQVGLIISLFSLCQLFASPITGKLSDRYGRKPLLLISQFSTFIGFLLLGITNSVWLLIVARLIDGLLGSNMTVCYAYISDITSPEDRTKNYGYLSAVFGLGIIFGPVIGGTLSAISYTIPMFLAAIVSLISIILVIIFLPESLKEKKEKSKLSFHEIIPVDEIKHFFKDYKIKKLLILFFLYSFGLNLFMSSFALFFEQQIQITALEVGFLLSWIGIIRITLQGFLIKPLEKRYGEDPLFTFGIYSIIITMILLTFTINYFFAYIPLGLLSFGTGVWRPIFTSKLTKCVSKEESGSLLGVNQSLASISQVIAPVLGGTIVAYFPSFLLPAISTIFFIILFIQWHKLKIG